MIEKAFREGATLQCIFSYCSSLGRLESVFARVRKWHTDKE